MRHRDAITELINEHRQDFESELADARAFRSEAEAAFAAADREVATLEAILAMASPATEHTEPGERTTLHEAMRKVLLTAPGRRMLAAELAKSIDERGLYKMRDGRPVEAQQIHARVGHYGHMFERDGQGIRLV